MVEIVPLHKGLIDEYERFLSEMETSLLYYSVPYMRLLEQVLDAKANYWVGREGGRITGILPVLEKSGSFGRVMNSLPFYGSHGGVLAATLEARQALERKYGELTGRPDVAASNIVGHPLLGGQSAPGKCDYVDERIGQITFLPDSKQPEAEILGAIDGSARRNINKAARSGVQVRVDCQAVGFLDQIHRENMKEIGGIPKPDLFFKIFPRYFVENRDYRIYTAAVEGELVAALLVFYFNNTVEYFTPVIRKEFRGLQPLAKILFHSMVDAAKEGRQRWNWGGTWKTQKGVYQFKKKWGAKDFQYSYYVTLNNPELLHLSPEDLRKNYPGFYLLPYDRLYVGGAVS